MIIKKLITDQNELVETKLFFVNGDIGLRNAIRQDLEDTLTYFEDRLFLCSNEIGRKERAFAIRFKDGIRYYFNPAFSSREKIFINREKDILTGKEFFIPRWAEVVIQYQNENGEYKADKLNEVASVVVCQAMNILDGIFASDIGLEVTPEFDEMSEDDKKEILSGYIEYISNLGKEMDKELTGDSETHDQWSAAKFVQGVADSTIQLDKSNNEKKRERKFLKAIKDIYNKNKFWRRRKK